MKNRVKKRERNRKRKSIYFIFIITNMYLFSYYAKTFMTIKSSNKFLGVI